MARYIGPKNKKNRRFGLPLQSKQDSKKSRGSNSERRLSDYGCLEKSKNGCLWNIRKTV